MAIWNEKTEDEVESFIADDDGSYEPELEQDPEPVREAKGKVKLSSAQVKITTAVKRDIKAKVTMLLILPGGVYQARDIYCGSVFLQQTPDIADALTDIICDSPEMVVWFTKGGAWIHWLALMTALQPVAVTMWGHHVTHTVGDEEEREHEDFSAFHAPPLAV